MSKKSETTPSPEKFTVAQIRDNAYELFGITVSTFDGATYNKKGKYTIDEIQDFINKWLKKEVK